MLDGDDKPIKALFEGGGMPLEASLLCLAPADCTGPPMLAMVGTSESVRQSSPVAKKSREPKMMWLPHAKVSPTVKEDD